MMPLSVVFPVFPCVFPTLLSPVCLPCLSAVCLSAGGRGLPSPLPGRRQLAHLTAIILSIHYPAVYQPRFSSQTSPDRYITSRGICTFRLTNLGLRLWNCFVCFASESCVTLCFCSLLSPADLPAVSVPFLSVSYLPAHSPTLFRALEERGIILTVVVSILGGSIWCRFLLFDTSRVSLDASAPTEQFISKFIVINLVTFYTYPCPLCCI